MIDKNISRLKSVKTFDHLIVYLRDELDWPIEVEDAEDIIFDYVPVELGVEEKYAAKIKTIKQIRPLTDNQPWGIFYIEFEPKKLPVVVLRRILRALIHSRRKSYVRMKTWDLTDLIFISSLGEIDERKISFAHFSETEQGLPELRTFSWDASDTYFHYLQNKLDLEKLQWPENEDDADAWYNQWSSAFTLKHREVIRTSQQLATEMAHLASQIREQVKSVFEYEVQNGPLHKLFGNFKKVLIHDLEVDTFADMYAQTIAYGLFSARVTHEGEFAMESISAMVPKTNPFLKNLFEECTKIGEADLESLDLEELGVTELVKMLKESNIEAVLQDFGRQKKGEDPVIHFYELFLREYDPEQKVKRGIFYTPDPVVSFIVRSVDYLIKKEFDCPDGLADTSTIPIKYKRRAKRGKGVVEDVKQIPQVQILDPATGTGTFQKHVIEEIKKTFDEKYKELSEEELRKKWNEYVPKHLLPRLFGFELMMAPYAVAHLKLGLKLAETGYDFKSEKRLGVYLTNTLEGKHKGAGTLDAYYDWLAEEGNKANIIKATNQISIIIGNPPYSGESANKTKWTYDLMRGKASDDKAKWNYFDIEGNSLGERNPKWLNDDYVKFIRFGQWRIDKTEMGILAFITAHGYIDNPTFRGMREKLLKDFNQIYILDLHGNANKKETCPDGSKDENVFDIRQGVAISIFIKTGKKKGEFATVKHTDFFGLRDYKYQQLFQNDIHTIKWDVLDPQSDDYLFIKQNTELKEEYEKGFQLTKLFSVNVLGYQTHRDKFAVSIELSPLKKRLRDFVNPTIKDIELKNKYYINESKSWNLSIQRKKLMHEKDYERYISKTAYRPFDNRYTILNSIICDRSRTEIITHILNKDNYCLLNSRQQAVEGFRHCFITHLPANDCVMSTTSREANQIFPLYLYPEEKIKGFKRVPNLDNLIINRISKKINLLFTNESEKTKGTFAPLDILDYIYTILHSPSYREKYKEFLKIDFPWVPYPKNAKIFWQMVELGGELRWIHLLKSQKVNDFITTFPVKGTNLVKRGYPKYKKGKVWINPSQYFEGPPEVAWEFYIGGYQPAQKWLKDRRNRELTAEDIDHYQKIIVALTETDRLMKEIDKVIEEHGGWPLE